MRYVVRVICTLMCCAWWLQSTSLCTQRVQHLPSAVVQAQYRHHVVAMLMLVVCVAAQVPMCKVNVQCMEALLGQYRGRYSTVVGFQPTGWSHGRTSAGTKAGRRIQRGTVVLYQVCRLGGPGASLHGVPELKLACDRTICTCSCAACAVAQNQGLPASKHDVSFASMQVPYSEHSSFAELREFVQWFQPIQIIPSVGNDKGGPKCKQMLARLAGRLGPMDAFARPAAAAGTTAADKAG